MNKVIIIEGMYIRINVAVTINNVNVVRIFARRSCRCCRSKIRCASRSNPDERRADEIDSLNNGLFGSVIDDNRENEC